MESRGWWSKEEDEELKTRLKNDVMSAFRRAEERKRHELKELFEDVYAGEEPWNIVGPSSFDWPFSDLFVCRRNNEGSWCGY